MAASLKVDVSSAIARFDRIGPNVHQVLVDRMTPLAQEIAADARSRALAHIHFLGIKPGAYVASIYGGISDKQNSVVGFVRSSSPLAHLLEFGAKTPAHDILPKVAAVLAFQGDAGTVFARAVRSPGATIPPYPAIYPAFEAVSGQIEAALTEAVRDAAAGEG